ncbi:MAG: 3-deoxy-7-phosphoheptulonate synthase, partial [Deltaproteobacteria bacterium]|nr:3-deoxy-7-phosphoheptulonate synthase [Deltaproteobacteria bacterium]
GGDCAERFIDCTGPSVVNKLKILMQMSLVLTHGARRPVVRIGRMAGQFAKPRSSDTQLVGDVELPSYRGDNVNGFEPTAEARRADPERLLAAYFHSSATLNYVRALVDGGFGDLHHPEHWNLDFMADPKRRTEYERITQRIVDALEFLDSVGGVAIGPLSRVDFFTSHEGLILSYEEALTREVDGAHYNLGAHFLWIGERTRKIDGAHLEYFRGLANPIGIKVGPTLPAGELVALCDLVDPDARPGRLSLITRYGATKIAEKLPDHIDAVHATGRRPLWVCDPMHGNGSVTPDGTKTRDFDAIVDELNAAFDIHERHASRLGGIHFELTGEDVTECVGGPQRLRAQDLSRNYATYCDPRLNYAQSLEIAFLIASRLRAEG